MNRQAEISEKDMTLLCEYLDDAMSIKDRAKFEKRLQQSPELKQGHAQPSCQKSTSSIYPDPR